MSANTYEVQIVVTVALESDSITEAVTRAARYARNPDGEDFSDVAVRDIEIESVVKE